MKELWKRKDRMEKEMGGGYKEKCNYFSNCYFFR
jgi:hypothetical protein